MATDKTEATLRKVQADSEGVESGSTFEFQGQTFSLPEKVGLMPLLAFANAAKKGLDSDDMEGAAAMYALLRDCLAPDEWDRFEQLAIESRADGEELLVVVSKVMELMAARPTQSSSASSQQGSKTSRRSKARSSSRRPEDAEKLTDVSELLQ